MKCKHKPGALAAICGIPVDPCTYELVELWANVTVSVRRCPVCGSVDLSWVKQDDTVQLPVGGEE